MVSKSPSLGEEGVGVAFPEDGRDEESAKVVSDPSDSVEEGVVGFDFVNPGQAPMLYTSGLVLL